jgi:tetratricopeptide (TPR) repeat protein
LGEEEPISKPVTSWWWFLPTPSHPLDNFDWLWNALTIVSLTLSATLITRDISTRFLIGGTGFFNSFAIISQSVLTLLTVGGVLTEAGRKAVEQTLSRFGVKTYLWQEIKFGLSALLLLSLIAFKASFSEIANYFNEQGWKHYQARELGKAISNYEIAINFDPDNAKVHRNLGLLYEILQDLDKAQAEYKLATRGDLSSAYNNLARLYLLKQNSTEAITLLWRLRLTNIQPPAGQVLTPEQKFLRYNLEKNFGWARFQQKRYADAQAFLEEAIAIHNTLPDEFKDNAAQCLLAQVFVKLNTPKKAKPLWEPCIGSPKPYLPEIDEWISIAQKNSKSGKK